MTKNLNVIVAALMNWGIGKNGQLPVNIKGDLAHFKRVTTFAPAGKKNAVIMGRNTWESLPVKFRPLPQRENVVISSQLVSDRSAVPSDVTVVNTLNSAITHLETRDDIHEIFVIGGQRLYKEALESNRVKRVFLTRVAHEVADCDAFFHGFESSANCEAGCPFVPTAVSPTYVDHSTPETPISYDFAVFEAREIVEARKQLEAHQRAAPGGDEELFALLNLGVINKPSDERKTYAKACDTIGDKLRTHEEFQYLDLIHQVVTNGTKKEDRTGTGTYSQFGAMMRFSLKDDVFPLLTTKKTFLRGIAEELFWFLQGDTSQPRLAAKKVHIWDANATREFLDKRGLPDRPEGDLGPVYGFQWRRFGAPYKGCDFDYDNWTPDESKGETKGVDQLADCINLIKNDPDSRRIIMTAWNPQDLPQMALPPCHMFCQFYVANGKLSCSLYQRSADLGLGVPFNIASYALMTRMLAQVCDLEAGDFVHVIGDAHVYSNHVEPLMEQQLNGRMPRPFPVLKLNKDIKKIEDFKWEDITVTGYYPHGAVKMAMAV